tara:strand:+ start:1189 stop:1878 length:690 start_codon:yes stop_codon:yes gene_type:complete
LPEFKFNFVKKTQTTEGTLEVHDLIIAGWTGRDTEAVEKHILELEKIGIPRPSSTPIFYRASPDLLTQGKKITVVGNNTSGEVEVFIVFVEGELWLGVGSDHTDRETEAYSVAISKQACAKPISRTLWNYKDVEAHWDRLVLRSFVTIEGERQIYQEGELSSMMGIETLINKYNSSFGKINNNSVMFCGTLAAIGGIRPSNSFEMELFDPTDQLSITHSYDLVSLPNIT